MDLTYSLDGSLLQRFPGFLRGVVVARGVKNSPLSDVTALLRETEETLRRTLTGETLKEDPRILSWREAFRGMGMKPGDFRPSAEGMLRRVLRGQALPSVNPLVDIGNIVSLRRLFPVGCHAVDRLEGNLEMREAQGTETFLPFDSESVEHPEPGEPVFLEGNLVLTRRFCWRQGRRTLTLPDTTAVEFNVDALPPSVQEEVEAACREIEELVVRFCGGSVRHEVLHEGHRRMVLLTPQEGL